MSVSLDELAAAAESAFASRYRTVPQVVAAAPGRVNLIGEHIDYNDGFVLPMAIERHTVVAVASNDSSTINIHAPDIDDSATIDLSVSLEPRPGHWTGYILGVVAGIQTRVAPVNGFDAVIQSNVPLGGGLSSSAALTVAFATAMEGLTGLTLKALDKALLCKAAENNYAGVPCGIMDPMTSAMGQRDHALFIDCVTREVTHVPFASDEVAIVVTNSGVRHDLAEDAYAQRQAECKSALAKLGTDSWRDVSLDTISDDDVLTEAESRRSRHIASEISRTRDAADAIVKANWIEFGRLMNESHRSLRDDFEVSCTELDILLDLLESTEGVYGARMTGGGFGGCTVALVRTDAAERVMEQVRTAYREQTGIDADSFITRPADGAALFPVGR